MIETAHGRVNESGKVEVKYERGEYTGIFGRGEFIDYVNGNGVQCRLNFVADTMEHYWTLAALAEEIDKIVSGRNHTRARK
jgi:hypothetical protein